MTGGQVQIVDLVKRFAEVTAVDGINLDVAGGEFFSLLGPSGCGKTTTLRLIAGFEQPTEGRILLDGRDVAQTPPHKRNVNTVFQSYALFPFLTVEENVAFGLRYKNVTKDEARKMTAEALARSDRLAVMSGGRIEQIGSPVEVYEDPSTAYVADFLGVSNLMSAHGEGAGRVRVGDFELMAGRGDLGARGRIRVVVRPERVHLEDHGTSGENRVPGMVERVLYVGSII